MMYRVALSVLSFIAFSYPAAGQAETPRQFRVWATSCTHVPADIRRGRESLAKVIRQSEGLEEDAPAFEWDVMIDAGDVSAHQTPPGDRDGRELIRQYRAMTKHRREQVYNVPGNHDAPYYDHGPGSWFRKWGDPLGENTVFSGVDPKRRPFPVEGTWERYCFQAGNILFLMLSDRNDAPTPVGRGHSKEGNSGGYPPGAVTRDTFNWWTQQVLNNQDKIIVTMHHHALRDTTTASGYGEGNPTYHGSTGGAEGSSYLYFIIEKDDPNDFQYTRDAHVFEDFLDTFHKEHGRGAIDFWVAGHTHVKSPDDNFGDKTISETRWGVNFLQVAGLTRYHGGSTPLSRLLTFTDGSDQVKADVYLHEAWYEDNPVGWYAPASKTFSLRHKFAAPTPIEPLPPFPEAAEVYDELYVRPKLSKPLKKAGPSPDLTTRWDKEKGGSLDLEALLAEDTDDRIDSRPLLVAESPAGTGHASRFDGTQRIRVGQIDMENWTDLTVSAWINTTEKTTQMRVASKDRIGTPGNFMLLYRGGAWLMQAWDDQAGAWCAASWRSASINDGRWHSLVGVVDSRHAKVLVYVDGELKAEAPWTAKTLDDSDKTDLVIGADSDERQFGHTFHGMIHDVHLYARPFPRTDQGIMPGNTYHDWREEMKRRLSVLVLLVINAASAFGGRDTSAEDSWVVYQGSDGPGQGKHIVLVSGDEEYRSEESLPMLGKILAKHHGFRCTVLFAVDPDTGVIDPDNQGNIPGLEALQSADLMIIHTRFRDLPDEQMRHIDDYIRSGRPVIGIRAAVAGFRIPDQSKTYARYGFRSRIENWEGGFGQQVLGMTWIAHHGRHGAESTRGVIASGVEDHPIVRGCKDIWGPTDVYRTPLPLPGDSQALVMGQVLEGMNPDDQPVAGAKNDPMMPIAWTKTYRGASGRVGRVFTSTIGAATDFESEGLRRLLVNASFWCLNLEGKIPPNANVEPVGDFRPTPFGFRKYQRGIKPTDHAMSVGP